MPRSLRTTWFRAPPTPGWQSRPTEVGKLSFMLGTGVPIAPSTFTTALLARQSAPPGPLHPPWGLAKPPADFGPMSNAILISNNTSRGRINAFDPKTGRFLGPLCDASHNSIEIDNIWAVQFGHDGGPGGTPHNSLFFTAGPDGYAHGLFGVITFGQ